LAFSHVMCRRPGIRMMFAAPYARHCSPAASSFAGSHVSATLRPASFNMTYGATDEIGFHSAENRRYVTDIHATVMRCLGLDSRKLEVPGRKRLDLDHGEPIKEILV